MEDQLSIALSLIVELRARIKELEHKKDSSNSSIAPSKDENRKTRSLRKKSGKKTGGQQGHKGHTLKMSDKVDQIVEHSPNFCEKCGNGLGAVGRLRSRRQIIDIPPIEPIVTEHRVYAKSCTCGYQTCGKYPEGVKSPVSYGKNVKTLIAYMSTRQYISMNRIKEFFSDVFGLKMSEGTIKNSLVKYSDQCGWIYEQIRRRLLQSHWVGSDETGYRLNGKKGWMWTWQNTNHTYIYASTNRGGQTIKSVYPQGLPKSILLHDCWRSYFSVKSQTHQICLAHLLRELQYFIENREQKWAYQFSQLLYKAIRLKKKMLENIDQEYAIQIDQIHQLADKLIKQPTSDSSKKLAAFQKRMKKYKSYLFPFLEHKDLPYDNNSSERAIRNVKVKLKVSGMFKTHEGAQNFAVIRSVIDTCIKNNKNIFTALTSVAE